MPGGGTRRTLSGMLSAGPSAKVIPVRANENARHVHERMGKLLESARARSASKGQRKTHAGAAGSSLLFASLPGEGAEQPDAGEAEEVGVEAGDVERQAERGAGVDARRLAVVAGHRHVGEQVL